MTACAALANSYSARLRSQSARYSGSLSPLLQYPGAAAREARTPSSRIAHSSVRVLAGLRSTGFLCPMPRRSFPAAALTMYSSAVPSIVFPSSRAARITCSYRIAFIGPPVSSWTARSVAHQTGAVLSHRDRVARLCLHVRGDRIWRRGPRGVHAGGDGGALGEVRDHEERDARRVQPQPARR